MDRSEFLRLFMAVPAAGAWLPLSPPYDMPREPRRLSSSRFFTRWMPGMEPAYRVQTGEIVVVETSHGMPGLVTRDGIFREAGPDAVINPQTGPIFIEGIASGDTLAVDILDIEVGEWGYCSQRIFELRNGFVHFSDDLRLPVQPMLGCLGIAPSEGSMDTRAPSETGGNMDCREVRKGSTVVFKARVDGALAGMGDAHALQGDGEINGQGIETDARALVRFRKLSGPLSDRPVIIREDSFSTVGANGSLEEAAWQATDDMVALLRSYTGRSEDEARLIVGMTGNLRINQIVDPTKGARMEVPAWVFGI